MFFEGYWSGKEELNEKSVADFTVHFTASPVSISGAICVRQQKRENESAGLHYYFVLERKKLYI